MNTYLKCNVAALLNLAYSQRKRAPLFESDDWLLDKWGIGEPADKGGCKQYARIRKAEEAK